MVTTDKEIEELANKVLKELNVICEGKTIDVHYDVLASLWLMFHIVTNPNIKTAKQNLRRQEEFIIKNWIYKNSMMEQLKRIQ